MAEQDQQKNLKKLVNESVRVARNPEMGLPQPELSLTQTITDEEQFIQDIPTDALAQFLTDRAATRFVNARQFSAWRRRLGRRP